MSALTLCYTSLGLANKLLSGLRADDSGRYTRALKGSCDTSLEVNCSASVFGCSFGGEKGKEKSEPSTMGRGGRVSAAIDSCKLNLSIVFVNGVRGNRFVAVVV